MADGHHGTGITPMWDEKILRKRTWSLNSSARFAALIVLAAGLVGAPLWVPALGAAEPRVALTAWSPLDGKSFNGEMLSAEGKVLTNKEKLVFQDGQFASEACRRFGFSEGPYWLRIEDGKIQFIAETVSPDNGTMRWKGTISEGRVDASFVWTNKPWYWTIEQEFRVRAVQER